MKSQEAYYDSMTVVDWINWNFQWTINRRSLRARYSMTEVDWID